MQLECSVYYSYLMADWNCMPKHTAGWARWLIYFRKFQPFDTLISCSCSTFVICQCQDVPPFKNSFIQKVSQAWSMLPENWHWHGNRTVSFLMVHVWETLLAVCCLSWSARSFKLNAGEACTTAQASTEHVRTWSQFLKVAVDWLKKKKILSFAAVWVNIFVRMVPQRIRLWGL